MGYTINGSFAKFAYDDPKKLCSLIYVKVCDEYNNRVGRYQLVKDLQSSQFQMTYQ